MALLLAWHVGREDACIHFVLGHLDDVDPYLRVRVKVHILDPGHHIRDDHSHDIFQDTDVRSLDTLVGVVAGSLSHNLDDILDEVRDEVRDDAKGDPYAREEVEDSHDEDADRVVDSLARRDRQHMAHVCLEGRTRSGELETLHEIHHDIQLDIQNIHIGHGHQHIRYLESRTKNEGHHHLDRADNCYHTDKSVQQTVKYKHIDEAEEPCKRNWEACSPLPGSQMLRVCFSGGSVISQAGTHKVKVLGSIFVWGVKTTLYERFAF